MHSSFLTIFIYLFNHTGMFFRRFISSFCHRFFILIPERLQQRSRSLNIPSELPYLVCIPETGSPTRQSKAQREISYKKRQLSYPDLQYDFRFISLTILCLLYLCIATNIRSNSADRMEVMTNTG